MQQIQSARPGPVVSLMRCRAETGVISTAIVRGGALIFWDLKVRQERSSTRSTPIR
jgi:hypothetical protein